MADTSIKLELLNGPEVFGVDLGIASLRTCKRRYSGNSETQGQDLFRPQLARFPKSDPGWLSVWKGISLVGSACLW